MFLRVDGVPFTANVRFGGGRAGARSLLRVVGPMRAKGTKMARGGPKLAEGRLRQPLYVDRHIGARIRQRRVMLGLSQLQTAEMVGVTYQQAFKYEKGINRLSAGRLLAFAQALDVDIAYFFEGVREAPAGTKMQERLTLELARNFAAISNPKHREALAALARAMAAKDRADGDSQ